MHAVVTQNRDKKFEIAEMAPDAFCYPSHGRTRPRLTERVNFLHGHEPWPCRIPNGFSILQAVRKWQG